VGALAIGEAFGAGNFLKTGARGRDTFGWPWDGLTLWRNARMELERAVLDLNVVFEPQPVDPSLADVAPRSNEVAENQQLYGHAYSVPPAALGRSGRRRGVQLGACVCAQRSRVPALSGASVSAMRFAKVASR